MPRALDSSESSAPPITLTESPNSVTTERSESPGSPFQPTSSSPQNQFVIVPEAQQVKTTTNLHPYTRPLTVSDVDSCAALENAAFTDPSERATPEKVCPLPPRWTRDQLFCLLLFLLTYESSFAIGYPNVVNSV